MGDYDPSVCVGTVEGTVTAYSASQCGHSIMSEPLGKGQCHPVLVPLQPRGSVWEGCIQHGGPLCFYKDTRSWSGDEK